MACEWRSEDSLEVLGLSFGDVGSRASDSGFRLDGKHIYPMSHFTRPVKDFKQYLLKKDYLEKCSVVLSTLSENSSKSFGNTKYFWVFCFCF